MAGRGLTVAIRTASAPSPDHAKDPAERGEDDRLDEELASDVALPGPEGLADADLMGAFVDASSA